MHGQKTGISRVFCEPDDQKAGITRIVCEPHGQNAGFFATCTVKMLEILAFFVKSGCPSGQWSIATDGSDWWPS